MIILIFMEQEVSRVAGQEKKILGMNKNGPGKA